MTALTSTISINLKADQTRAQTVTYPYTTFITSWTLGLSGTSATNAASDPNTGSQDNAAGSRSSTTTTTSSTSSDSDANTDGVSQNALAGIIGGVVSAIVLILVAWFCCGRVQYWSHPQSRTSSSRIRGRPPSSSTGSYTSGYGSAGTSGGESMSEMLADDGPFPPHPPEGGIPPMPQGMGADMPEFIQVPPRTGGPPGMGGPPPGVFPRGGAPPMARGPPPPPA